MAYTEKQKREYHARQRRKEAHHKPRYPQRRSGESSNMDKVHYMATTADGYLTKIWKKMENFYI